jgi:hypothetical protein
MTGSHSFDRIVEILRGAALFPHIEQVIDIATPDPFLELMRRPCAMSITSKDE